MGKSSASGPARQRLSEGAALVEAMVTGECVEQIAAVAEAVTASLRAGGKILLFGNGGSAADALHKPPSSLAASCLSEGLAAAGELE